MPHAKKRLGQHFLSDPRILARIAEALAPEQDDTVLEIGPGRGGLTAALVPRARRLIAIERDRELVPGLRERFPSVDIVEADALKSDWHELVGPRPFLVTGNIPYNITSPLIDKALTPPRPVRIVFLVQEEVADRLAAPPDSKEYGALTVGVRAVASVERLLGVPAGAFFPRPKVDSAVVRLTPRPEPLIADSEVTAFRRFVVGLFGFRRKQLMRGLRELTGRSQAQVAAWLEIAGLSTTTRPGELTASELVALYRASAIG
jgi:16S rRNA (adenine1518-N6/adenine1519-N6)-dimethyltransferase